MTKVTIGTKVYTGNCLYHPNKLATCLVYRKDTHNAEECIMHVCDSHWSQMSYMYWYTYIGKLGLQ